MPRKIADKALALSEDILDLVPEQFRDGVLAGSLLVQPKTRWYNSEKPVIIDAVTKRLKYGRYNTANNIGEISKKTAYKRTSGYKEMRERYITAQGKTKESIISLEEIIQQLWEACMGSPQKVKVQCPHPDDCPEGGGEHVVAFAFRKDPKSLFSLYENIVGRATETAEVSVNNRHLVELLHDTTPLNDIRVIDLLPEEMYSRKALIEGESIDKNH